jgi:hypothetical protein
VALRAMQHELAVMGQKARSRAELKQRMDNPN